MAQKRMFSLKVIDTDLFIEMPQSTRLLYYELCMRADDDGFIASPNKIRKIAGCSEDDYKILMAKQYIIPFESGVCVIKHWRIHNLIRADRYNETEYRLEKSALIDNNGKYELGTQNVIPIGNQMDTQVRLGKVRVGKVSKDNNNEPVQIEDITEKERTVLNYLKGIIGYVFDYEKDLVFIRELTVDFPNADLLDKIKEWNTWLSNHPLTKKSNCRLQVRNWIKPKKWDKGGNSNGSNEHLGEVQGANKYREAKAGKFFS